MPAQSSLAALTRVLLGVFGLLVAAWLAWLWPHSHAGAIAGALVLAFWPSAVLAFEFVVVKLLGDEGRTPEPTTMQLARAWWAETLTMVRVFYWRQPFRWRAEPDALAPTGRRAVVLVHGFVCNRGLWNPWMRELRTRGHPFVAVNLEPVFGSIDEYAPLLAGAIARAVEAGNGRAPLVVCHSMGGLAMRACLRRAGAGLHVHHVVTIASPHGGTWLGRFSRTANGRQMRLAGEWVRELAGAVHAVPFTCWYSNCDNVVFPASTATLPGAHNRFVPGVAHVELAFHPEVLRGTLDLLARSE